MKNVGKVFEVTINSKPSLRIAYRCPQSRKFKYVTRQITGSKKKTRERVIQAAEQAIDKANQLSPNKTLQDVFDYWFAERVKKKTTLRTQTDYEYTFDEYLAPLANEKFSDITSHQIHAITNSLEMKGKNRTAQKVHGLIRQIYNDATRMNIYDGINPADQMFPPSYKSPESPCLTKEQVKQLLEASTKYPLESVVIPLALETGMRPGEYFGLRWHNVDLDKREIKVVEQITHPKGGGYQFKKPKRNSIRTISISQTLADKLIKWQSKQKDNKLDLVFLSKNNTPIDRDNFNTRNFKRLLSKAKLPEYPLYCLRHTTATLLLLKNTPIKKVSALLGHANTSITADIYSHYIPEMQKELSAAIEGLIYD